VFGLAGLLLWWILVAGWLMGALRAGLVPSVALGDQFGVVTG